MAEFMEKKSFSLVLLVFWKAFTGKMLRKVLKISEISEKPPIRLGHNHDNNP